jgi:hypothetical protein
MPENYKHSYAFLELGELLMYSIRELGHEASLKFNELTTDRNIIIGCHLLSPSLMTQVPKSTIILNTEQIYSDDSSWNENIFEWIKNFEVWDYSLRNIEKIKSLGISNFKHLRIGYQKELKRIEKSTIQDIDVLFYGSINDRRKKILDELKESGLRTEVLFGVYGEERDKFISRSKIVLNFHYYKSQIFEIVRVFYLLHNDVAVVSEINESTSIDDQWRSAVSGAPYENLVNQVISLSNDASLRKLTEKKGRDAIEEFPQHLYISQILN